jgi:hypothetical protein
MPSRGSARKLAPERPGEATPRPAQPPTRCPRRLHLERVREGGTAMAGVGTGYRETSRSETGPGHRLPHGRGVGGRDRSQRSLRLRRPRARTTHAGRRYSRIATAAARRRKFAVPLSGFVHLKSERALEPVRKDCSFAEKQQPQLARLLVVRSESLRGAARDARSRPAAKAVPRRDPHAGGRSPQDSRRAATCISASSADIALIVTMIALERSPVEKRENHGRWYGRVEEGASGVSDPRSAGGEA